MPEQNETIESLTLKLKKSEEKNEELTNKISELNSFIQKQNSYIQKLREEINAKEVIILQYHKSGIEKEEKVGGSLREKSPRTPLSIKTSFPNENKISYKFSKFASPTTDGSFSSFTTLSPIIHVEHMSHSSTDDSISTRDYQRQRKASQSSQLIKETKFSASESNIISYNKSSNESINVNKHIAKTIDDNDGTMNSLDFEDKEVYADQITVFIQKLFFNKNDKNKKDVSFIISIRNADTGDELWRIDKSYTDIQNLENTV